MTLVVFVRYAPLGECVCVQCCLAGVQALLCCEHRALPVRSGTRQAKSLQSDLFCSCVLLGVFFSKPTPTRVLEPSKHGKAESGLNTTPTDVAFPCAVHPSTPLQRCPIMKTLTHLHGYV